MNTQIKAKALFAVENTVKGSLNSNDKWMLEEEGEIQVVADSLQTYSYKSQASLSASAYDFYQLHSTILSPTEILRKKQIVFGSIIVVYLPAEYFERGEEPT